jgi:hypothetical protein
MSISRVQEEVSSKEFLKHIAFYRLFGRGSDKVEAQLADLESMFYNSHIGKGDKRLGSSQFMVTMPLYDRLVNGTVEEKKVDNMQDTMARFTQAFNIGQKKKNGNNK